MRVNVILSFSKIMLRMSYLLLYCLISLSVLVVGESKQGRFDIMPFFQFLISFPVGFGGKVLALFSFQTFKLMLESMGLAAPFAGFQILSELKDEQGVFLFLLVGMLGYAQWFYLFPALSAKLFRPPTSCRNGKLKPLLGALVRFSLSSVMLSMSWGTLAFLL